MTSPRGYVTKPLFLGATSGDQELVSAVTGDVVDVIGYKLVAKTAVAIQFKDAAGTTATSLSGTMTLAAGQEVSEPVSNMTIMRAGATKGVILNLSAAAEVAGYLIYRQFN